MKAISTKTWNKRGNEPIWKENLGCAVIFSENETYFSIDLFEGRGVTYKEREQPNFEIKIDGEILFSGTKEELKSILYYTQIKPPAKW